MSLYLDDGDVRLYHGDALTVLQTLEDASVHMCVTSPPFYSLRDYGTGRWEGGDPDCDHRQFDRGPRRGQLAEYPVPRGVGGQPIRSGGNVRDEAAMPYRDVCGKCGARRVDQQIGLEETPSAWVDSLVAVFREVRRVLRPEGTLWLEVGDSYAAGKAGRTDHGSNDPTVGLQGNSAGAVAPGVVVPRNAPPGYKPKDLIGAPWALAFALRADGWYLRSDIVWARPNPMPESVTDRPTKSHSYVFLLAKRPRYFFDAEAVREKDGGRPSGNGYVRDHRLSYQNPDGTGRGQEEQWLPGGGRNARSVWNISTQPFSGAHFATFPEELARRCILAGTSERGCCPECGAPWIRQVEQEEGRYSGVERQQAEGAVLRGSRPTVGGTVPSYRPGGGQTLGWRLACTHGDAEPVPTVVIDPFVGSGTVPYVARKHGRHAIGIDLSSSYLELASRRLQQLSLFA